MNTVADKLLNFCNIQLQVLKQREDKIRKDLLDCKIQQEFLTSLLEDLTKDIDNDL